MNHTSRDRLQYELDHNNKHFHCWNCCGINDLNPILENPVPLINWLWDPLILLIKLANTLIMTVQFSSFIPHDDFFCKFQQHQWASNWKQRVTGNSPWLKYSISQEICTRFCCALLCCGYAIVHNEFTWSIYPYSSGLLCWHWGSR